MRPDVVPVRRPHGPVELSGVVLLVVGDARRGRGSAEGVQRVEGVDVVAGVRLDRVDRWCGWGVLAVQALCLSLGFYALHEGARDSALTLGMLGMWLTALALSGRAGRRTRRMVE